MIKICEDKLNRENFINSLFQLFENFGNYDGGGLTIALNGKYGSGKSTVLNFIEEKNDTEEKFNIIRYDAWKNNLFDNPLIPILYSMNRLQSDKQKIKELAKNVIKKIPRVLVNTFTQAHGVDVSSLFINENIFDEYQEYIKTIDKYKDLLKKICASKKTILLIDELDRCLPEYQIKVLETLYNVFNIPDLILVIAIDKSQLEHIIKKIFGNQENVSGYLSKFIQYEINLPNSEDLRYCVDLMDIHCSHDISKQVCADMLEKIGVAIRKKIQIIKELNIICNEKHIDGRFHQWLPWYPVFTCFVLIVKSEYREIYQKYFCQIQRTQGIPKPLPLQETRYEEFLQDIKSTRIANIIKYLVTEERDGGFILYLLNYFYPIEYITSESLSEYMQYEKSLVEDQQRNSAQSMPGSGAMQNILNKIKILNFN